SDRCRYEDEIRAPRIAGRWPEVRQSVSAARVVAARPHRAEPIPAYRKCETSASRIADTSEPFEVPLQRSGGQNRCLLAIYLPNEGEAGCRHPRSWQPHPYK